MSTTPIDPSLRSDSDLDQQVQAELAATDADALMEQSVAHTEPMPLAEGESVVPTEFHHEFRRGRVSAIRGEDVFIDITGDFEGRKLQGVVPLIQFERAPRMGSIMDFVVDRIDETQGLVFLSREGAISRSTWDSLVVGSVVEARVTGHNKGGLELELVGSIKAFMPASQVDLHPVGELEPFHGQKLEAMVQEIDRKGKKVLLSRRRFLEGQKERNKKKVLAELAVGQERDGVVSNLTEFGCFVDLGGVDGLVHVSDMAHARVDKPGDVVKKGDKVKVKVLKIDGEKGRISLGMKQVLPDPWIDIPGKYQQGEDLSVRVLRTANFGAFVEVEPGVEALLPVSELSWKRIHRTEEVVKEGDVVKVRVLELIPEKHRFTVSLKAVTGDPWVGADSKYAPDAQVEGRVTGITDFGAFVELELGVEGMVHISELADRRVGSVDEVVKVGEVKTFRVKSIDLENHKLSLSLRAKPAAGANDGERGGRGGSDRGNFGGGRGREEAVVRGPAKAKLPKSNLKSGLGNAGAMGTGLGGLRIEDFK